jgi:hypothetical protein
MNKQKLFLVLSLIGILILIIISQGSSKVTGKIEKINFYSGVVKIKIQNNSVDILIFEAYLPLKENQTYTFCGKYQQEKNSTSFIVDKIIK